MNVADETGEGPCSLARNYSPIDVTVSAVGAPILSCDILALHSVTSSSLNQLLTMYR